MLQRPVHKKIEKLLPEKRWATGLIFVTQVKNKTTKRPTPPFLQNQPVTARGINNKNFFLEDNGGEGGLATKRHKKNKNKSRDVRRANAAKDR